jgi:superfamily I DNA and/or RNA helicase
MLWSHILRIVDEVARGGDQHAKEWLKNRQRMMDGIPLSTSSVLAEKAERKWRRLTAVYTEQVFTDDKIKIVICTCNNAAHNLRQQFVPWLSIVDEAAFGAEYDVLIPLTSHNIKMVLLSGDHEQLTPIVTSTGDNEYSGQISTSVFARLIAEPDVDWTQLKVNYRMHPDIADLPGTLCYTGQACYENTKVEQPFFLAWKAFWNSPPTAPLKDSRRPPTGNESREQIRRLFFNVTGRSGGAPGNPSLHNLANINAIVDVCSAFCSFVPSDGIAPVEPSQITIQVPYGAQLTELKRQLRWRVPTGGRDIKVSTIDSNQGGEAEMIILDLTVANDHHGSALGFLRDWHRMNVGLSRAKQVLLAVGNLDKWMEEIELIYMKCPNWAYFLMDLLDRGDVLDTSKAGMWSVESAVSEGAPLSQRQMIRMAAAKDERP